MEYSTRKTIRLKNYDYSANGVYFITICVKDKSIILSEIRDKNSVGADIIRPELTPYGIVVNKAINAIPLYYPGIKIDKYVIMPDHIHLIMINDSDQINGRQSAAPTIMQVIGQMKRWVSKEIGISIWQKSFFDHIIRDENDYITKWNYIESNPAKSLYENKNA